MFFLSQKKKRRRCEQTTDISNLKYIWAHRPSIKGTKLLFIVIKAIIIIIKNHYSDVCQITWVNWWFSQITMIATFSYKTHMQSFDLKQTRKIQCFGFLIRPFLKKALAACVAEPNFATSLEVHYLAWFILRLYVYMSWRESPGVLCLQTCVWLPHQSHPEAEASRLKATARKVFIGGRVICWPHSTWGRHHRTVPSRIPGLTHYCGRWRHSLCTCSSPAGARKGFCRHSLCTCSSPAGAHRCCPHRSLCTGSSAAGACRSRLRQGLCACSSAAGARRTYPAVIVGALVIWAIYTQGQAWS